MGGITLADNPPDDPEGSYTLPTGLYSSSLLKDLTLLNFGSAQPAVTAANTALESGTNGSNDPSGAGASAAPSFSISDFLVPALHAKVWDDWQAADDFTAFDPETLASSDINDMLDLDGLIGNTPIWENGAVPADQAYDEFVFDLTPAHFETPETVNVADLIVGPHSMASAALTSVSPLELTMANSAYDQDLALANLYGFNESSTGTDSESESGSEESDDADDSDEDDDDDDEQVMAAVSKELDSASTAAKAGFEAVKPADAVAQQQIDVDMASIATAPASTPEDPNKRRMEEALATRISNDLGPEHMAGLFKILKGTTEELSEDEDEEVEIDLSCLDETTLVQVYQYVETCCMQTMGSILAAEKRERAAQAAAMERAYQTTPELSPGFSSNSPSPPPKSGRRSNGGHKKRHGGSYHEPAVTMHHRYQESDANDQATQSTTWNSAHPYKARRKRANTVGSSPSCRKTHKEVPQHHYQQYQQTVSMDHSSGLTSGETVVLRAGGDSMEEMEYSEDAEIDVVGI
ncbi:hypothetical protein B0O80DRAFT_460667 [Mortierella sp. GBAus27b]|nr:hypothetical protein BGX31_000566 [Mortierella sp. GBA43]KAI8349075.1 hypothetical protein B0O80DRAFT_460667 [Mortierella sp. GBAus27b]